MSLLFSVSALANGLHFPDAINFTDNFSDAITFTVTSKDHNPIANADVTIITGAEQLHYAYITDELGQISLPNDLEKPVHISLSADGYIPNTSWNLNIANQVFTLDEEETTLELIASGVTKNYGRLKKDGFVDFSLVIPSLRAEDIIFFDLTNIISPLSDKIKIDAIGQEYDIPSNISLPRQSESYLFFNIKFNKPEYRVKLSRQGKHNIVATHGKFNLKKIISNRNKSVLTFLDHFEFLSSGDEEAVFITSKENFDIDVNEVKFTETQTIEVGDYGEDNTVISVGLVEGNDERYFPSDVKRALANETKELKFPANIEGSKVLSALIKENTFDSDDDDDDSKTSASIPQMSVAFTDPNVKAKFLELVAPPVIDEANNKVNITPPALPDGLKESNVLVILSEIEVIDEGSIQTEKKTHLWQGRSFTWINSFDLPEIAGTLDPDKQYRWEVLFLAQDNDAEPPVGFKNITHVTRNSFDF